MSNNRQIEIVEMPLLDIRENPENGRLITDDNRQKLDYKLHKYGNLGLLVVNQDNVLISGHQRLRLLKEQGVSRAYVARGVFSPDEFDKLAHILNDSNYAGEWDYDKLEEFRANIEELGELDLKSGLGEIFIDSNVDFNISDEELEKSAERYQKLLEPKDKDEVIPYTFATTSDKAKKIRSIIAICKEKHGVDVMSGDAILSELVS